MLINSLTPNDAMLLYNLVNFAWWHQAPEVLWYSPEDSFTGNVQDTDHYTKLQSYKFKITTICLGGQLVKILTPKVTWINFLAPGRFKLILLIVIDGWRISCETAFR